MAVIYSQVTGTDSITTFSSTATNWSSDTVIPSLMGTANTYLHDQLATTGTGAGTGILTYDPGTARSYLHNVDFYKDYKTQTESSTFWKQWKQEYMGEFVVDNDAPYTRDKTYVKDILYHPDHRRLEVDFDTYRMYERDTTGEKRYKLKRNLTVMIKTRAEPIYNAPLNERTAIDTLREMITEQDFRKYIKHGFILVRANNGYTYQIFRNEAHTKVWHKGSVIKEVCVRLKSSTNVPPTDNVIAFKVMVESDPDSFEQLGNVYKMAEAA